MASKTYRDLMAWQKAMDLVVDVYRATEQFPKEEIYALTSQIRRASVSIPSNIAEGRGRGTANEFAHFLRIAHGSLRELETQLLIARRLDYLNSDVVRPLLNQTGEVGRLLNGLLKSLRPPE
jgi:four helix bundle protein